MPSDRSTHTVQTIRNAIEALGTPSSSPTRQRIIDALTQSSELELDLLWFHTEHFKADIHFYSKSISISSIDNPGYPSRVDIHLRNSIPIDQLIDIALQLIDVTSAEDLQKRLAKLQMLGITSTKKTLIHV